MAQWLPTAIFDPTTQTTPNRGLQHQSNCRHSAVLTIAVTVLHQRHNERTPSNRTASSNLGRNEGGPEPCTNSKATERQTSREEQRAPGRRTTSKSHTGGQSVLHANCHPTHPGKADATPSNLGIPDPDVTKCSALKQLQRPQTQPK
ncbi:hypothetical protein VPH35_135248 [Triticum aestivum]